MKLIFFDIDGTLISEKGHFMPESTKKAIRQARKNGHICMVNTGRSYRLVKDWLPQLVTFDGYLCGCGTHIIYQEETLFHQTFDYDTSKQIVDGLERYEIDAILEGADNNFYNEPERIHTEVFREYARHFVGQGYGTYEESYGNFDKFYCYAPMPWQTKGFFREFDFLLDWIDRERGYFEVAPKGLSKASAMEYMANYFGISMNDTVAIGDSNNDLQMLQAAGIAIAMGNGNENVKRIADYVTKDVEEDGIYHALKWLGIFDS